MSGDEYYKITQQLKPALAALVAQMVADEKRMTGPNDDDGPMNEDLELAITEVEKLTPDLSALGWWLIAEVLDLILDQDAAWTVPNRIDEQ
jgi:hypothetical protein